MHKVISTIIRDMNPDPHFAYLHDGASKLCASAERVKHLVEQMDFEAARQEFVKLQSAAWVMAVRLKLKHQSGLFITRGETQWVVGTHTKLSAFDLAHLVIGA